MVIYFYSAKNKYGCFSNFSPHGFELDGKYWPTSEHYFQAQKFVGTEYEEKVRNASTPTIAKRLAWNKKQKPRADWDNVRDDIMRRAVLRKFETHEDIRDILLSTGDEVLIENSPIDNYWGCGADGSGRNMLGKVLMETRDILKKRVI